MGIREDFGYRLSLAVGPRAYVMASRLLYATCRLRRHDLKHLRQAEQPGPFIAAFWHYDVFNIAHLLRAYGKNSVAMVSGSRDGEYVARVLALLGFETVRGSRHKGGLAALKKMMAVMKRGLNGAVVVDGSQGPVRVAQAGAVLLAARTGAPIVPMLAAADRYWAFPSWDRTILPKPFARLDLRFGEPLFVPVDLSAERLETLRAELETRLNGLYEEAWAAWGKSVH